MKKMDNDSKIFYLWTLIALLAGIIGMWVVAPALESGLIQYISGGAIIISVLLFIILGVRTFKDKHEDKKISQAIADVKKSLPNIVFENTDKVKPIGANDTIYCGGGFIPKVDIAKLKKVLAAWTSETGNEYFVIDTFCRTLLSPVDDDELKSKAVAYGCTIYTYPDGWDDMTTRIALETKFDKIKAIYDLTESYGAEGFLLKDRQKDCNFLVSYMKTSDKVKLEYRFAHKLVSNLIVFMEKMKALES